MNYHIEQRGGKWIIVHPEDPELTWVGNHWAAAELWGTPPLTFASEAAAAAYAKQIWGKPT